MPHHMPGRHCATVAAALLVALAAICKSRPPGCDKHRRVPRTHRPHERPVDRGREGDERHEACAHTGIPTHAGGASAHRAHAPCPLALSEPRSPVAGTCNFPIVKIVPFTIRKKKFFVRQAVAMTAVSRGTRHVPRRRQTCPLATTRRPGNARSVALGPVLRERCYRRATQRQTHH